MRITCAAFIATAMLAAASASAVPVRQECHVTVLRSTTDDMGRAWKKGDSVPVDIERDSSTGGSFCAHGGSCLPRTSEGLPAVRLDGCRVGSSIGNGDHRLVQIFSRHRAE